MVSRNVSYLGVFASAVAGLGMLTSQAVAGDQKQDIDPELLQACPQVGTVETEIVPNNFVYDLGKYSKTAFVSGDINMDGANRAANTIVFRDSSDNRDVFLSIASGGGDPIAARSVIDAIDETPNQVVARITGQASSAAALIGVYADVVFASQNARMVLHPPYVSRIDSNHVSLKDFREYAAFLEEGIEFSVEIC